MAINKCDPCEAKNCVGFIEDEMFKKWMVQLFCDLIAAIEVAPVSGGVNLDADSVAVPFGSVTPGASAVGLTLAFLVSIGIVNNTNTQVQITYSGGKLGPVLDPGVTRVVDFGANGGHIATSDIFLNYVATPPTLGSVLIDALSRSSV